MNFPLTSTEIFSLSEFVGEKEAIKLLKKAGFDCYDLSLFHMARADWKTMSVIKTDHPLFKPDCVKYVKELKKIADDNGIICNQSHAPFPVCVKDILDKIPLAIECAGICGAKAIVVHPDNNSTPEQNAEMYFKLLPVAKDNGVKIATENMWNWSGENSRASAAACYNEESFLAHLKAVNDDDFVACLDLGHAEMFGDETSAVKLIEALGDKLYCLHIHDNDRLHDSHQLPFTMDIDFDKITTALAKIGYKGEFTLESDQYLTKFTPETVLKGVDDMYSAATRLATDFYNKIKGV